MFTEKSHPGKLHSTLFHQKVSTVIYTKRAPLPTENDKTSYI